MRAPWLLLMLVAMSHVASDAFSTTHHTSYSPSSMLSRMDGSRQDLSHRFSANTEDSCQSDPIQPHGSSTRRSVFHRISCSATTAWLACFQVVAGQSTNANAACLMGDTSPDCIGVYKMPLDDEVLPFVDTAEKLRLNAPDVRWVPPVEYPKTYKDAKMELAGLQVRCQALNDIVLKGLLTEAGTEILGIVPRLTVAGRVVIRTLNDAATETTTATTATTSAVGDLSMKAYRAEVAHTELLAKLGQCDILIGQGISGQLGALTPAQIQILSELREANTYFEEFMRVIPDGFFNGNKQTKR